MLLLMLATTMADRQETTEPQEATPQMRVACYTDAEQSDAARTIAHLFAERLAIPVYVTGDLPGYHPTHSKPKCLHQAYRDKWHDIRASFISGFASHRSPIHQHAIDYYIYTLEHILI